MSYCPCTRSAAAILFASCDVLISPAKDTDNTPVLLRARGATTLETVPPPPPPPINVTMSVMTPLLKTPRRWKSPSVNPVLTDVVIYHCIGSFKGTLLRRQSHKLQIGAVRHDAPGILGNPDSTQSHPHVQVDVGKGLRHIQARPVRGPVARRV